MIEILAGLIVGLFIVGLFILAFSWFLAWWFDELNR